MAEEIITIELNPRERRIYDRFRSQVSPLEPGASSGARDILLLLPDLTVLLARLLRDRRVPRGPKLVALLGFGYVISPLDVLPTVVFGPIGLVDDIVVVSATLSRLLNHVHPDIVRSHWSGKGDALEAIQRATHWSESLFTSRLRGFVRGLVSPRA
jgi:uncharacterized membrane protein YkvA (DUF1232 family)